MTLLRPGRRGRLADGAIVGWRAHKPYVFGGEGPRGDAVVGGEDDHGGRGRSVENRRQPQEAQGEPHNHRRPTLVYYYRVLAVQLPHPGLPQYSKDSLWQFAAEVFVLTAIFIGFELRCPETEKPEAQLAGFELC